MLLISCSGASTGSDESIPDSVLPTTSLPDTTAAKCDRIGSRMITEFVAAFNDGVTDLDPYFASGEDFQWYSDDQRVSIGRPSALYDPVNRDTLIAYLNLKRKTRGSITIRSLKFTSFRPFDQATGYAMELDWDGYSHLGKASVHCGLGQINVWGVGSARP